MDIGEPNTEPNTDELPSVPSFVPAEPAGRICIKCADKNAISF